ncbi:MAG: undecaprenyldiphospho-muramoylpentapeptide beta-N-acetylglucosaminyltransferase [candidate division Zixibacteria bacterium]|nr:undecaprenyldiphospho-muramoylpentapeptide beta-N-acetylglucosaminyltransferase [candidate division Zixibacteria bacterium]
MTAPHKTARLLFAGGGTGGHLYPAVAIADRITELLEGIRPVEIIFVGTKRGLEYRLGEELGYPLRLINVRGLVRSFSPTNLLVPFVLLGALRKAASLLKKFDPHIVIGTGGYVSWPVLRMAARKKITAVIQEQNSFPGITTRKLAPKVDKIYLGSEKAREYLKTTAPITVTGNPVRRSLLGGDRVEALEKFKLDPTKKTILIIGGSQGARALNRAILKNLEQEALNEKYQLLWQTGKRDYKEVIASSGEKVKHHSLFPFENNMALVYAAADLVISRAGALALAEFEACRLPAILVPYPFAAGDHQRHNAREFVERGFAVMFDEKELPQVSLLKKATALMESGEAGTLRENIVKATANKKPAVDIIAEDIINLISERERREGQIDNGS